VVLAGDIEAETYYLEGDLPSGKRKEYKGSASGRSA
jgi:hypothetical protein